MKPRGISEDRGLRVKRGRSALEVDLIKRRVLEWNLQTVHGDFNVDLGRCFVSEWSP